MIGRMSLERLSKIAESRAFSARSVPPSYISIEKIRTSGGLDRISSQVAVQAARAVRTTASGPPRSFKLQTGSFVAAPHKGKSR